MSQKKCVHLSCSYRLLSCSPCRHLWHKTMAQVRLQEPEKPCITALPFLFHWRGNVFDHVFPWRCAGRNFLLGWGSGFAAADYLKAYAIDCPFTAIFFCYTGFYNGIGKTRFVMIRGILGAFCVRVPVSYIMSIQPETSLFHIGLATPMSSALQLILCVGFMLF